MDKSRNPGTNTWLGGRIFPVTFFISPALTCVAPASTYRKCRNVDVIYFSLCLRSNILYGCSYSEFRRSTGRPKFRFRISICIFRESKSLSLPASPEGSAELGFACVTKEYIKITPNFIIGFSHLGGSLDFPKIAPTSLNLGFSLGIWRLCGLAGMNLTILFYGLVA